MTVTTQLTIAQRDQQMIDRYVDGETLASIGDDFGVTRERVRQIITKIGGSIAEQSRTNRQIAKAKQHAVEIESFMDKHGKVAERIAAQKYTRDECLSRLQLLYPDIDNKFAEDALRNSEIVFRKSSPDFISSAAIRAGVWYLIGAELGLEPAYEYAATYLDLELMEELTEVLANGDTTSQDVATIFGVIGAAQQYAVENPDATITGAKYQELRSELITTLGWISKQDAVLWPPTRQTLQHRFGSWNEALRLMGLATSSIGRSLGLLKFTDKDYEGAIINYVTHCEAAKASTTFARYDEWVKAELGHDRARPSGASLRNYFGSWSDAMRFAGSK